MDNIKKIHQLSDKKKVILKSKVGDIKVVRTDEEYMSVSVFSEDPYKYKEEIIGDIIKIKVEKKKHNNLFKKSKETDLEIMMKIPKTYSDNLDLCLNVGDIEVNNIDAKLNITNNVGAIKVMNSSKISNIKLNVGDIKISNGFILDGTKICNNVGEIGIDSSNLTEKVELGVLGGIYKSEEKNIFIKTNIGDFRIK